MLYCNFYSSIALPSAGLRAYSYTTLDLSQVDFQNVRGSGFKEYITVNDDDDFSGEHELYRLVGVAPASAVSGGAAKTYADKIGQTIPVYNEPDDNDYASFIYSPPGSLSHPLNVRAKALMSGNQFVVLLSD